MGFSWVKIADFLSVSERTLRNKTAELEISLKYSQITEMQLDAEVQTILTQNLNMGEKMLHFSEILHTHFHLLTPPLIMYFMQKVIPPILLVTPPF